MVPIIIDIEASGFGRGSYPIEVGIAFADGTTFCSLIKPEDDWTHWDSQAQSVHNIERSTLYSHGCSVTQLAQVLNTMLDDHDNRNDTRLLSSHEKTTILMETLSHCRFAQS